MNKRGVFYTLTLSLFSLALLSLAFLSLEYAQANESRYAELGAAARVYDLHNSMSKVFTSASIQENTTYFTTTNNSIIIHETFPLDFSSLDELVASLKADIESDFPIANISTEGFSQHSLYFLPMNISHKHLDGKHLLISGNPNITGYNVSLTFSGILSCSQSSTAGSLHVEFYAFGGGSNCSLNTNVDEVDITMTINGAPAALSIDSSALDLQSNVSVKTRIGIDVVGQPHPIDAQLPIAIVVRDPAVGFIKNAYAQFPRVS